MPTKKASTSKTAKKTKVSEKTKPQTQEMGAFVGKKLPQFKLEATSGKKISSDDVTSSDAVLYFYPKDSTSGCTKEGEDFRDLFAQFKKLGVSIYGVSRDSVSSHEKFKDKYNFPFELLSDKDETLCKALDILKMKSMYGRQYLGVDRSTFYIGSDGKIKNEWRAVKVPGHAEEVLSFAKKQK